MGLQVYNPSRIEINANAQACLLPHPRHLQTRPLKRAYQKYERTSNILWRAGCQVICLHEMTLSTLFPKTTPLLDCSYSTLCLCIGSETCNFTIPHFCLILFPCIKKIGTKKEKQKTERAMKIPGTLTVLHAQILWYSSIISIFSFIGIW